MGEFRVVASEGIREEFARLILQARVENRLKLAKQAAKTVVGALETNPGSLGEPLYQLKHLALEVRHVVQSPWSIHFAVDDSRKLVYLKHVTLLSPG